MACRFAVYARLQAPWVVDLGTEGMVFLRCRAFGGHVDARATRTGFAQAKRGPSAALRGPLSAGFGECPVLPAGARSRTRSLTLLSKKSPHRDQPMRRT